MKPILFNVEMVRALLEGHKTVTRRVVQKNKTPYHYSREKKAIFYDVSDAPYHPGDILYVRETWHQTPNGQYWYKADNLCIGCTEDGFCLPKGVRRHKTCDLCEYVNGHDFIKWRPSIHMPREAARIFLRVTDVRVELLRSMLPCDIQKEGCQYTYSGFDEEQAPDWYGWMKGVWDSTKKPADLALYGWDANPWVWVIEFERTERPTA